MNILENLQKYSSSLLSNKKISFWLILSINILIVSFYFINNKFIPVHDFTGGARIYELSNTLQSGQFPPRWSQNLGFGYGMPIFQFYAPLFFSLATLIYLLGFSTIISLKIMIIITVILGFYGMYLLAKFLTDHNGGLLAATAFTLAPYHAVNIYVRGAFSEALAISYFPWILLFSIKILRSKSFNLKNYLWLTIFLTGLFLTHNVTVLTFLPIYLTGMITAVFLLKIVSRFSFILLSLFHSIIVSAFFLFPAFLQKGFTRVSEITGGYSYYKLHFLYFRQLFIPNWKYGGSVWGIGDDMSFYLGNDILIIAILASILTLYFTWKKQRKIKQILTDQKFVIFIMFGLGFLMSIFLTSFKSQIIWDHLPLVSFIQFPWRFLGIASFLLAILTAYLAKCVNKLAILFTIVVVISANGHFFHPRELYDPGSLYDPDQTSIKTHMSGIIPDYLPKGINWERIIPAEETISFDAGDTEIIKNNAQQILVKTQANKSGELTFNRYIFPNWQIKLDNHKIDCGQKDFIYHCQIPAGEHIIRLYWSEKGLNLISDILSILGIGFMVVLIIKDKRER